MFEKMQRAFWKALTPDLVVDEPKVAAQAVSGLPVVHLITGL